MSGKEVKKQKMYNVEELREVVSLFLDEDALTIYGAEDVQRIFKLGSIDSAYKLMKHPAFPLMRIGKQMKVTKGNLVKFIEANSTSDIELT